MAKVFAKRAYDMTSYNLHALDSLADVEVFLDKPYSVNGTNYPDRVEAAMKDGSGSLVFASKGLAGDGMGGVVGNVNGLFHSTDGSAAGAWAGIQGVAIDINSVGAAWDTPSTTDDMALLRRMLSGADTFDLSFQGDKAKGFGGADVINGNGGADRLWGGSGIDQVNGGAGSDTLYGEDGADIIRAGTGRDVLNGGGGKDLLIGGTDGEADRFVFNDWIDSGPGNTLRDEIRNFTRGSDHIDLRPMDADEGSSGSNETFHWSGTQADEFAVWYKAIDGGVLLRADVSGDAIFEFEILVKGVSALGQGDVYL
jgi:Ca2+-binding RTX toxin-like protein